MSIGGISTSHDVSALGTWIEKAEELVDEGIAEGSGITFACLMRYDDFQTLLSRLRHRHSETQFNSVNPWSKLPDIKLLHIDDEVTMLPPVAKLKGVLIGPSHEVFLYDTYTSHIVKSLRTVYMERRRTDLAFSIVGDADVPVHAFQKEEACTDMQDQVISKPAFTGDIVHLYAGMLYASSVTKQHPTCMPVQMPKGGVKIAEILQRISIWGLFQVTLTGKRECILNDPLGKYACGFVKFAEWNIKTMVLLGCIRSSMPNVIRGLLVDMAVLLLQGPSNIFSTSTAETKRAVLEALEPMRWYASEQVHLGQLWLSLACLHAQRTKQLPENAGSRLRRDVIHHCLNTASEIREYMLIPEDEDDIEET